MSTGSYLAGIAFIALILLPWGFAGPVVAGRLHAPSTPAGRALAGVVVALSGLTVSSELIGAFGGFHRGTLGVGSLLTAALAIAIARRWPPRPTDSRIEGPGWGFKALTALVAGGLATAQWMAGMVASYRSGITQVESLHYHLPHAAYFVQTGTDWRPHEVSASSDAAFHPLNVELLHALGMVSLRSDYASLFVDIVLLWIAFLAVWVAGERVGGGAVGVCGLALVCAAYPLGGVSGGTALNDIGVIAFVLAAVALAPSRDKSTPPPPGQVVLCGLALGLALGTKLSTPGVVAGLLLGWMWVWRGEDWRERMGFLAGSTALTGAFWYVRDWWFFGSPLPGVSLEVSGHGFAKVPTPAADGTEFSVAHYATNLHVIHHWFIPALKVDFGTLWPAVLLLPAAGVLLAFRPGRPSVDRAVGLAAVIAFVAYLFTPTGAQGLANAPVLFGSNVRYAAPAFVLGMVCLARERWINRSRITPLVLIALTVVELANQRFWPGDQVEEGIVAAVLVIGVVAASVVVVRRGVRTFAVVGVLAFLVLVSLGKRIETQYLMNRYSGTTTASQALFAEAPQLADYHIGVVGLPLVYPFYGPSFGNQAQYVGDPGPDHQFNDYTTCQGWLGGLARDHINAVVVMAVPGGDSYRRFAHWTVQGGAHPIFRNEAGSIFRVPAPPAPADCA